jgi:hypothetical protein
MRMEKSSNKGEAMNEAIVNGKRVARDIVQYMVARRSVFIVRSFKFGNLTITVYRTKGGNKRA